MSSIDRSRVQQMQGHLVLTVVAAAWCGILVLCGTFGGKTADEAGLAAAWIAGFIAVGHVLMAACHYRRLQPRHGWALLLACAAPAAFLVPVLARPDGGWPVNPGKGPRANGRVHSRVVTPGDVVSMSWTAEDLKSVGGMWRGTPRVRVLNADELGCSRELPAQGQNDTWDRVIWTEAGFDSLSPFLTAEFRIPCDESLVGKSLRLQTTLSFEFPTPQGKSSYIDQSTMVTRFDDVLLASSSVKRSYWDTWSTGATIGMTSTLVGGLLLVIFSLASQDHRPQMPSHGRGSPWRVGSAAVG